MTVRVNVSPDGEATTPEEKPSAPLQDPNQMSVVVGNRPVTAAVGGPKENPQSILGSARTPSGATPQTITEKDVVTVIGQSGEKMETSVASAVQLGCLRKDGGRYVEVSQAAQRSNQGELSSEDVNSKAPEDSQGQNLVNLAPGQREFVQDIQKNLGDSQTQGLIHELITKPSVEGEQLQRYADQMDMDVDSFVDHADGVIQSYQNHIEQFAKDHGVEDFDHFNEWMWSERNHHELQSKLNEFMLTGDPSVYLELMEKYPANIGS